jgi:CTP:molybdopterin cytidylyltransferase MocA
MVKPTYDAVILAAGKNTRLKGVVPSSFKPLMIVNGRPLIVTLVKQALSSVGNATVVVSPQNCAAICEVLYDNGLLDDPTLVRIVVQPAARGPGEGLQRALLSCHSQRVLLLLGDNIVPSTDIVNCIETDVKTCAEVDAGTVVTVCTTVLEDEGDALRFTRVSFGDKKHLSFVEGEQGGEWPDGSYKCWVGPMLFDRLRALNTLRHTNYTGGELKISGPIGSIPHVDIRWVKGSSVDVGTSDALLQLTEN